MLFTGRGRKHGYDDGWHDGVFRYYGEGQLGDMAFTGGNKAIRDSAAHGKDLHVFETAERGFVRYLGNFTCSSWEWTTAPDTTGTPRKAMVFHLIPVQLEESAVSLRPTVALDVLRQRAHESATGAGGRIVARPNEKRMSVVRRFESMSWRERTDDVRRVGSPLRSRVTAVNRT